jgi:hypothetical protein
MQSSLLLNFNAIKYAIALFLIISYLNPGKEIPPFINYYGQKEVMYPLMRDLLHIIPQSYGNIPFLFLRTKKRI